jgi:hypothetical protein
MGYSGSISKIGIYVILTKKSKLQFLGHLMETNQIFDSILGISITKIILRKKKFTSSSS